MSSRLSFQVSALTSPASYAAAWAACRTSFAKRGIHLWRTIFCKAGFLANFLGNTLGGFEDRLKIVLLQKFCSAELQDIQMDGSGAERLLKEMKRSDFMRHRSFLSKIAAFAQPDVFIDYDSYAKDGLVQLGAVEKAPDNYVSYLEAVREIQSHIGKDLEEHLGDRSFPTGNGAAFRLRILDVYLIMSGGRAFGIKSDRLLVRMKRNSPEFRLL